MLVRRLRRLFSRRRGLPAPWDGAIVRPRRFFVTRWTAAVGKAYRRG